MHDRLVELSKQEVGLCTFDVPLKECGWWRIGGPADLLVEPCSVAQLQTLVSMLNHLELPYVVIGDGSNLLFDDAGLRGVVIRIGRKMSSVIIEGTDVVAGAGCFVPRLISSLGRSGLSGLEHAVGIPGTLGGLVLMNGGSQRKGVGSQVESVWTVNEAGLVKQYSQEDCRFSYRQSVFQQKKEVVYKVQLSLVPGDKGIIRKEMLSILRSRRNKFPLKLPNCGSVFISNPKMYSIVGPPGKVIEDCGLKGFRIGGAMVSDSHANFIVNMGDATARDVLDLIHLVHAKVKDETGFSLESEVIHLTDDGRMTPAHKWS